MDEQRRGKIVAGSVLIALGLGLFAVQFFEGITLPVILFLVGGAFLTVYLVRREYGFLVPGCILLGLATGFSLDSSELLGSATTFGLGLGFIAIYLIALVYERRSQWWPLIPGAVLVLHSFRMSDNVVRFILGKGWPLILVLIGIVILFGAFGRRGSHRSHGS